MTLLRRPPDPRRPRQPFRRVTVGATLVAMLFMTACQTGPVTPRPIQVQAPTTVDLALAEAVRKSSDALATLSRVESTKNPPAFIAEVEVPEELKRPVTLDWHGPMPALAEMLAQRLLYRYSEIGTPNPTPIIVTVKVDGDPVHKVLEDIGLQAGSKATLVVNPGSRLIEVRHEG